MAEENKHPPTTEEQTPPEMPGKAPKMEQAEIPDVGGGPAPSAKVIDLSAVRSTPEKDAPTDIPKEPEAQPVSVTEYSKQEWKKPMPEPEKPKPKRGRPAKAEKATPTEPGAKKEVKAEKPRRGRPPKTEKASPEQAKPPKAGKTHAAPEEKAAPPAPEVPPTPRDATRAEKEEIVYLDLSDLHPFKDHPFGVRDDAEMKSLVESVRNGGVNQPALVRPREGGGYEIIAGHRRQMASQLAGYRNMPCIHNHIYYNSTAYDRSRKFRNFIGSSFALRRLSDRVCLEHDLSVIANPKLHSKGRYLHYGQWLGENQKLSQKEQIRLAIDAALTERPKDFADFLRRMETAGIQVKRGRGGAISFLVPGQQRAARFRASTLGDGYGPEDVQAVIDGKAPTRTATARKAPAPRRVNLLIDIQERMRQGKGPAYERWAKVYNLKQMAAALQYLKEHQLFEYDDLAAKTDAATERFHTLAGDIQHTEAELSRVSDLMAAVVQYAKTRPAFDGYKAAKYNRKYLAEHEAELADYRAAKATMAELLGGEKLPKMDVLKEKRRQLAARKKALYLEYRKAQQDMRELVAVKGSVDHLRGLTDNQRNKEQAR